MEIPKCPGQVHFKSRSAANGNLFSCLKRLRATSSVYPSKPSAADPAYRPLQELLMRDNLTLRKMQPLLSLLRSKQATIIIKTRLEMSLLRSVQCTNVYERIHGDEESHPKLATSNLPSCLHLLGASVCGVLSRC